MFDFYLTDATGRRVGGEHDQFRWALTQAKALAKTLGDVQVRTQANGEDVVVGAARLVGGEVMAAAAVY